MLLFSIMLQMKDKRWSRSCYSPSSQPLGLSHTQEISKTEGTKSNGDCCLFLLICAPWERDEDALRVAHHWILLIWFHLWTSYIKRKYRWSLQMCDSAMLHSENEEVERSCITYILKSCCAQLFFLLPRVCCFIPWPLFHWLNSP